MTSGHPDPPEDADLVRSERRSYWVALGITLAPIPAALLISWALGSPPWRPRADPGPHPAGDERTGHGAPLPRPEHPPER